MTNGKKEKQIRQKKIKVDLNSLPDAIVDGKFILAPKDKVLFERTLDKKTSTHVGHVFSVDETTGVVSIWDETKNQFYNFNVNQPTPVIKFFSGAEAVPKKT